MPRKPIDYQKTIIYKFVCNDESITDTYVGHTTELTKRRNSHKCNCSNENDKKYQLKVYQNIRANGGWDNWKMVVVEKYPCNDVYEAKIREQYWYDVYKAEMNTIHPHRTRERQAEYYRNYGHRNREKIAEYYKQYRDEHKETINEHKNQKHTCECGGRFTQCHKSQHLKSLKHKNYLANCEIN